MRIEIISVSGKQPAWVQAGFEEYARRIGGGYELALKELALARRSGSRTVEQAVADEGRRMLAAVPKGGYVVALDERAEQWSTRALAARLGQWARLGSPVTLLIGGPDGLAPACLEAAAERWSLSPLTLPHGLVRIIVAEALYRALSLNRRHPYHRA